MHTRGEKTIFELFRLSILLKALGSIGEMITGIAIAFIPGSFVLSVASAFTKGSTGTDLDDMIAHALVHFAHSFAANETLNLLLGGYLFVRGFVQFLIVIALYKNKLWAYPALIIVLIIIIATQAYAIYVSHSITASVVTIIDIITIYLVWHEYHIARAVRKTADV
jgi:uncharacterized membrane protein